MASLPGGYLKLTTELSPGVGFEQSYLIQAVIRLKVSQPDRPFRHCPVPATRPGRSPLACHLRPVAYNILHHIRSQYWPGKTRSVPRVYCNECRCPIHHPCYRGQRDPVIDAAMSRFTIEEGILGVDRRVSNQYTHGIWPSL